MNICQGDIPGASLNRRLLAYETYRPRFSAIRDALCIACTGIRKKILLSPLLNSLLKTIKKINLLILITKYCLYFIF